MVAVDRRGRLPVVIVIPLPALLAGIIVIISLAPAISLTFAALVSVFAPLSIACAATFRPPFALQALLEPIPHLLSFLLNLTPHLLHPLPHLVLAAFGPVSFRPSLPRDLLQLRPQPPYLLL
jgi:hypothetical protein